MAPLRLLCIAIALRVSLSLPLPSKNPVEEPIPQFVWDLYRNYSLTDAQAPFNTIRSFENMPKGTVENSALETIHLSSLSP